MSRNTAVALVSQFLGRQNTIPVPVPFVRLTGDYASAAFLAQCLYWGDRTSDSEGWFHKTHDQWFEELMLSPDQVRRCVRTCGDMIEVKRKGVPAQNYYRANKEAVAEALERLALESQDPTSRCGETQHLDADKPHDKTPGNPTTSRTAEPTSISKITSETTQRPPQREREGTGGRDDLPEHALAGESGGDEGQKGPGDACGAAAPDGASPEPAGQVTGLSQSPTNAGRTQATGTKKVPPGAADRAGGGPPWAGSGGPPNPTRSALLTAFGPVFLAQLLSESPLRQGWLSLPASRVAELHQQALESCAGGTRPWRTLFISQLDIEVTPKPANLRLDKPQEEWTREEWLS